MQVRVVTKRVLMARGKQPVAGKKRLMECPQVIGPRKGKPSVYCKHSKKRPPSHIRDILQALPPPASPLGYG